MSTGSSCLLNRSIIDSAQPLSNARLRKTLNKSINTSQVVVTPRVGNSMLKKMLKKSVDIRQVVFIPRVI